MKNIILIILFIFISGGCYGVSIYNTIIGADEGVEEKWAQVENVYQRRMDLIPNLVSTVKGYAAHEKETLTAVIEARSSATKISSEGMKGLLSNPQAFQKFAASQDALSSALSRLMVVVEKYPDLKASQNFLALQSQLEGTENRIAVERKRFNEAVKTYNVNIRKFPNKIIASFMGAERKDIFFKAKAGAEDAPKVEF